MSKNKLLGTESLAERMKRVKQEMETVKNEFDMPEPGKSKQEKITRRSTQPKLFLSGRLNRKRHEYTPRSLILLKSLDEEIKEYCRGVDLAILNYLIQEGLRVVKSSDSPINIDMSDIENGEVT